MNKYDAGTLAKKYNGMFTHDRWNDVFDKFNITFGKEGSKYERLKDVFVNESDNKIKSLIGFLEKEQLQQEEQSKQSNERFNEFFNEMSEMLFKKPSNNKVVARWKFNDSNLQCRYTELISSVNNNMPLSFFWLAGSIIEGVLCKYCKKNNIKSSKDDIDGYITILEKNNKISTRSTIYTTLQHFRQFRNTIHPNNQNNDFINDKNLQNYKQTLDDVIKFFTNDNQSD